MKTLAAVSLAALTFVLAACSGTPESQDANPTSTGDDALSATQKSAFAGNWNVKGKNDTSFHTYAFKTDGTYTATGGCDQSPAAGAAHCGAILTQQGTWKVAKSGPELGAPTGAAQLVLTDSFDQKDAFFYTMKDDNLSLSTVYRGQASTFEHDLSTLKKLRSGEICADKDNNTIGNCPEDLPCEYDGPTGTVQRCYPPI
jgi:hypothetical protein